MATSAENLIINQGSDYSRSMIIYDGLTKIPAVLTGYTFRSQMRKNVTSNTKMDILIIPLDLPNGKIGMSLTNSNTSLLSDSRYQYDIEMISPENIVIRILEGIITIKPNVTR